MKVSLLLFLSIAGLPQGSYEDCVQCSTDQPVTAAPYKNIWLTLSEEEVAGVDKLLYQKLNLTKISDGSGRDNTIQQIDLLQPNKSDVLPYLHGDAGEPKRYARATVLFGAYDIPYLQEYLVGPLPATNATGLHPLTFPFNNEKSGRSSIGSIFTTVDIAAWITHLSSDIAAITRELWNTDDGAQTVWATFLGSSPSGFDSTSILPLGVFLHLDVTSRQWQDWHIIAWYYRKTLYNSTAAFREAVFSPGFEKPSPNVDGPWTSTDKQGDPLPLDETPPPITVSEGRKRFAFDSQEKYVTWMDFAFFLSTSTDQGLSLFDIQYKGKRIIYELALQEALAHYAGADPTQSHTLFFDSTGGMGRQMDSLVKGYDCPSHATYLNVTYIEVGTSTTLTDAVCMFEADANYPIRRHFARAQNYTSVAKNVVFTVRWISTVGNYDYLFDYKFFYDGAIEIDVRASGYISAAYYADNEEYGFQIHDFLSGSLHDHVLTFKADLDILGKDNSVQKVAIVPATVEYPWSVGKPRNTMKLVKTFVGSEAESSISWAPNDAAIYAIVNKNSPNKYGENPGYRIKRSAMASHLVVQNSTDAGKAAHYATADFFVTKQKDTEPRLADRNNGYDVHHPLVDFSKFLDGESLDQEDLVLWFNLGMHHVPHTGDLPNTIMTSAHSAIRLEPLNYFDVDSSVSTSQQIKVDHTSGSVERFESQQANCSVDLSTLDGLAM